MFEQKVKTTNDDLKKMILESEESGALIFKCITAYRQCAKKIQKVHTLRECDFYPKKYFSLTMNKLMAEMDSLVDFIVNNSEFCICSLKPITINKHKKNIMDDDDDIKKNMIDDDDDEKEEQCPIESYVHYETFISKYSDYCKYRNLPKRSLELSYVKSILSQYGMDIVEKNLNAEQFNCITQIVTGIHFKNNL
jgi:hypothetical protein